MQMLCTHHADLHSSCTKNSSSQPIHAQNNALQVVYSCRCWCCSCGAPSGARVQGAWPSCPAAPPSRSCSTFSPTSQLQRSRCCRLCPRSSLLRPPPPPAASAWCRVVCGALVNRLLRAVPAVQVLGLPERISSTQDQESPTATNSRQHAHLPEKAHQPTAAVKAGVGRSRHHHGLAAGACTGSWLWACIGARLQRAATTLPTGVWRAQRVAHARGKRSMVHASMERGATLRMGVLYSRAVRCARARTGCARWTSMCTGWTLRRC